MAAENIANRFPLYFQSAITEEWQKNATRYAPILEIVKSPFVAAGERELAWKNYKAHLQQQVNKSVFDEAFGVSQIYIPLNAYFIRDKSFKDGISGSCAREYVVTSLEHELMSWVKQPDKNDLLRVISGGPGSGKSTFAKIFAAKVSEAGLAQVIFIELHKLDASKDLPGEITRCLRDEGFINTDPLDPDDPEPNLVVILDGLDELASQGRAAAETARAFVGEVERTLRRKNEREIRLRILLSGRELVIQDNETEFRGGRQVLNILPYFLNAEELRNRGHAYVDVQGLLKHDFREDWWKLYGQLTSNNEINGLPAVLRRKGLDEVTAQPLLNYLVALSYTRGKVVFDENLNLNVVYADLVEAVYERGYDNKGRHSSIRHLKFDEFQRVLEEIALSSWHGDGRTTTVREIQEHCVASNLTDLLNRFQEGASAGVTRLLAAFFFRQHGQRESTGDRTFVFTHKSFGEFLAACRVVRATDRMVKQVNLRKMSLEDGWSEREALGHCAQICGASACTTYIQDFIKGELARKSVETVRGYQVICADLFSHLLEYGMPMELRNLKKFTEELYQSRNAEETLMVVLNATAVVTKDLSKIRHPLSKPTAFGEWFRRIQGQRSGAESCLAAKSLSFLNLQGCVLDIADFFRADLSFSDLSNVLAHFTNFTRTNLEGANFSDATLVWATFESANLKFANFRKAQMQFATFSRIAREKPKKMNLGAFGPAEISGADFTGADLTYAALSGINLDDADFTNADMEGAKVDKNLRQKRVLGT